jgi:AbrB family looped-hinge helix DNA binding protein
MKATGIVRRIDDLGRIAIPKEIRSTLRIREGDPLEIFLDRDGSVIFKKYSTLNNILEASAAVFAALKSYGFPQAVLYDRDNAVMGRPQSYGMPTQVPSSWYDCRMNWCDYPVEDGITIVPLNLDGENIGFLAVKNDTKGDIEMLKFAARVIVNNLAE